MLMFLHFADISGDDDGDMTWQSPLCRRRLHSDDERLKRNVSQTFQKSNPSSSQALCLPVRMSTLEMACKIVTDDREVLTGKSMPARLFFKRQERIGMFSLRGVID